MVSREEGERVEHEWGGRTCACTRVDNLQQRPLCRFARLHSLRVAPAAALVRRQAHNLARGGARGGVRGRSGGCQGFVLDGMPY